MLSRFISTATAVLALGAMNGVASAQSSLLPREKIVLKSAISVDAAANTVVLPLHRGSVAGKTIWYIITDASAPAEAQKQGLLFAPRLSRLPGLCHECVQQGTQKGAVLELAAAPDFSATRVFKAGKGGFPPERVTPGATADKYTPFVQVAGSSVVYNMPIVATGTGPFDVATHTNTEDRVLAIDTNAGTVSLLLAKGFSNGQPILYISTEASDPGVAGVERATYAPVLAKAPLVTRIDILVFANGQTGRENVQSQGLPFAALDGDLEVEATSANSSRLISSLNILSSFPPKPGADANNVDYTPLWDVNIAEWSEASVAAKRNVRQINEHMVDLLVKSKSITGPKGAAFGPVGIVVNCPPVAFLEKNP